MILEMGRLGKSRRGHRSIPLGRQGKVAANPHGSLQGFGGMDGRAIIIDPRDNVATALSDLEAGSLVSIKMGEGEERMVRVREDIPLGHKFALKRIEEGSLIYKYGEAIGRATQVIEEGSHVHIHNVESIRAVSKGRGD